ncbi:MAG: lasso peptide biosynthesis B2 protein [Smithellaceae bacterium]|nr:lasso peptide biosynthesis B2 protein [Smithellaceae bacterium]
MTWLRSLKEIPSKWRRRTGEERLFLIEAVLLLGMARLMTLILPFKYIACSLGRRMAESDPRINTPQLRDAGLVGQAVVSASRYTLWRSVCLPQAIAAHWMLRRRGIPSTLYLGVAKDDANSRKIIAHAWVRCGNVILTGAEGHGRFTVVATFS